MYYKESISRKIFIFFNMSFLLAMVAITMYPVLHVLFASLSNSSKLMGHVGVLLHPLGFDIESYKAVFRNRAIMTGYRNTLFIVFVGVILNVLMTALGAYFLSRKNLFWKNTIMGLIVFTMFFNGGMIPTYFLIKSLGLMNNIFVLILPNLVNAYNIIIMRTAFMSIPDSYEESAKIDGAGHFTILFRIIIPLSLPTIAVMVLYYGVGHWNAWFNAMLYLSDRNLFPLQLILREILVQNDTNNMVGGSDMSDKYMVGETVKYAVIVVSTVPILCLYPFVQKYFIKGVMIGGLKG